MSDRCTQNGYAFTPCAFSSGGRPSPGALYLFNTLAEAAGDSIEPWYFYNCLLPRLFLTLAIEQYKHDYVTHDAILRHIRLAAPEPLSELDEPLAPAECPPPTRPPPPPGPTTAGVPPAMVSTPTTLPGAQPSNLSFPRSLSLSPDRLRLRIQRSWFLSPPPPRSFLTVVLSLCT